MQAPPPQDNPFNAFSVAELQELERGNSAAVETLEKEIAELYQFDRRRGADGTNVEDLEAHLAQLNARLKAIQQTRRTKQEQDDDRTANLIAAGILDPERDAQLAREANLATVKASFARINPDA